MDTTNNTTNTTMSNTTTNTNTDTEVDMVTVTSWTPIYVTLLISAIQGIIFYSFFVIRRKKDRSLYNSERDKLLLLIPDDDGTTTSPNTPNSNHTSTTTAEVLQHCQLYESRQYTRSHRSPMPFESTPPESTTSTGRSSKNNTTKSASWLSSTLSVSSDELLRCVGLDTYMYLRLLYIGTRITGGGTILSLILLPLYATGSARGLTTEQFNLLTIARVESDGSSWRLYVTVIVWYIFIGLILYEFWKEWTMYYQHRTVYDATGDIDMNVEYRYTVRVEQVPLNYNTDVKLRNYFQQLFPNQVRETAAVLSTESLEQLIAERHAIILKLEGVVASSQKSSGKNSNKVVVPKMIRVKWQKVEAIPYYESEMERYTNEIDALRQSLRQAGGLAKRSTTTAAMMAMTDSGSTTTNLPKHSQLPPADMTETTSDGVGGGNSMPTAGVQEEGVETGLDLILPTNTNTNSTTATTAAVPSQRATDESTLPEGETSRSSNIKNNHHNDTDGDGGVSQTDATTTTTSTAFVTLTSLRAKQAAIQCELTGNPDSMIVFPAADPMVGTIWKNVTIPYHHQIAWQFCAALFFTVGILFWAIPVSIVVSISNLNSLLDVVGLKQANPSVFWYGLVAGLLPVIMLAVLMIVLYMVITAVATNVIRYKSWPEVDAFCLYWHMLFQFANLWLLLIGGSLFSQIEAITEKFELEPVLEVIAKAMPASSVFFVNMIICSSFNAFGMELSMLVKYIVGIIMNMIRPEASQTQRQIDAGKKPPSLVWGQKIPPMIFIYMVSILYMPIVPIVSIFAFVYFFGTYIVMKHQCLHVYAQEFEGGGSATWQEVFGFLMACVYIGEFIFIVYMGIKTAPTQSALGFVPLIITVFYHRILYRKYIGPIRNLSLEVAADVDIRDGELSPDNDGPVKTLYRQPALNELDDERGPMPYRRDPVLLLSSTEAV